jgi:hypothetical protein
VKYKSTVDQHLFLVFKKKIILVMSKGKIIGNILLLQFPLVFEILFPTFQDLKKTISQKSFTTF